MNPIFSKHNNYIFCRQKENIASTTDPCYETPTTL